MASIGSWSNFRHNELTASHEEANRCAELKGENRTDEMLSNGGDDSSVCSASGLRSAPLCSLKEGCDTLHCDCLGLLLEGKHEVWGRVQAWT